MIIKPYQVYLAGIIYVIYYDDNLTEFIIKYLIAFFFAMASWTYKNTYWKPTSNIFTFLFFFLYRNNDQTIFYFEYIFTFLFFFV